MCKWCVIYTKSTKSSLSLGNVGYCLKSLGKKAEELLKLKATRDLDFMCRSAYKWKESFK